MQANVTGMTAGSKDFNDTMKSHLPLVFGFVLGLTFLLLLVTFRSLVIPIKAIVLNLLSVGASYGVLKLVFQDGHGESLLAFESIGGITSWLPLFLFVILFGLSMDYHVFILSRIREAVTGGMSTDQAVAHGIKQTAGVVSSAAVVMVAVFAIFATLSSLEFKQMGVGLAVAIFIDATIVRAVLLPATMKLLGDWNWYLPSGLRWLPSLHHEATPEPSRASTPENMPRMSVTVLVRGSGDVGSAVAVVLLRAGIGVAIHEVAAPSAPRRGMAFADAVFDGAASLDGVVARRIDDVARARARRSRPGRSSPSRPPRSTTVLAALAPDVLVDARMRKRAVPEPQRHLAPLTIGLGPNVVAGETTHLAIETQWGEQLGAVLEAGATRALGGEPRSFDGHGRDRFVYAPVAGVLRTEARIAQRVAAGEVVATIGDEPLRAPLDGILRGLTHDGVRGRGRDEGRRGRPARRRLEGHRPRRAAAADRRGRPARDRGRRRLGACAGAARDALVGEAAHDEDRVQQQPRVDARPDRRR